MNKVIVWALRIIAGLAVLVVAAGVGIFAISESKINRSYNLPDEPIGVPTDADSIANGKRLSYLRGCVDCHGENLAGTMFLNEPMVGTVYATNLTSGKGGAAATFTDADFVRAIRHGVAPDGSSLWVMPSNEFNGLSAEDIGDLIAYIRSVTPVDGEITVHKIGPMGRLLVAAGAMQITTADLIDHTRPMPLAVVAEPTEKFGEYLAETCHGCHGPQLQGGPTPGAEPGDPLAANLTPGGDMKGWQEADFVRAIREGIRPDGSQISAAMPWKSLGQSYTEEELHALWLYLQSLPSVATASK